MARTTRIYNDPAPVDGRPLLVQILTRLDGLDAQIASLDKRSEEQRQELEVQSKRIAAMEAQFPEGIL